MKNEYWAAIYKVFAKLEELVPAANGSSNEQVSGGDSVGEGVQPDSASTAPDAAPSPKKLPPGMAVVKIRAEIRNQLDYLRIQMAEHFTEREVYLVLFPIVAYFDEFMQTNFLNAAQKKFHYFSKLMQWPTLQKELFGIEDGGVLFYETLDDFMRKPHTPVFVYEIYYFCLNHGFTGKFNDNPVKLNEYKIKLRERIPTADPASVQAPPAEMGRILRAHAPAWYYASAVVALVAIYFLFCSISGYSSVNAGTTEFTALPIPTNQSLSQ